MSGTTGAKLLAHLARIKTVSGAIQTRQSIRSYLDIPIPKSVVEEILTIAQRTPSGGNLQPWKVYVVANSKKDELIDQITHQYDQGILQEGSDYDIYPKTLTDEYKLRRRKVAKEMYELLNMKTTEEKLNHFKNNWKFFGAPVGLIFTIDRNMQQGQYVDLGMYMQSIMLLCREKGLHTCAQEAWALWPKTIASVLQIPNNEMVFGGMAMGYADYSKPVNRLETEREDMKKVVQFYYDDEEEELSANL